MICIKPMAILRSLGEHRPAGLDFLINEGILPLQPPASSYEWTVYGDEYGCEVEEEIITTTQCVAWSQGGILRRVFKFNHENQEVQHALLTWFPREPARQSSTSTAEDDKPVRFAERHIIDQQHHGPALGTTQGRQARALVILLQNQAQIYFLNGHAHTINIPFDVEKAFPAPRGILLQRKRATSQLAPPSPTPLTAPPNSFWSSQNQASSSISYIQSSHSTSSSRPSFTQVPLPSKSLSSPPKELPSLFSLTDPLSELGLAVEGTESTDATSRLESIGEDEEVIYVTPYNEILGPNTKDFSLILILTFNRRNQAYSVWHASYADENANITVPKPTRSQAVTPQFRSRKRRSRANRLSTGAGTPALRGGERQREQSFSWHAQASLEGPKPATQRVSESFVIDGEYDADFPSQETLDPLSRSGSTTRNTRRTSSMLARAELSSQEQHTFSDMARLPPTHASTLARHIRRPPSSGFVSLSRSRLSAQMSIPGSSSILSDVEESMNQDGSVDFLEELLVSASIEASERASLRTFRGLRKDLIMVRALTLSTKRTSLPMVQKVMPPDGDSHVFVVAPSTIPPQSGRNIIMQIYIVHPNQCSASQLLIPTIISELPSLNTMSRNSTPNRRTLVPSQPFQVHLHRNVFDIIKLCDGSHCYALALRATEDEKRKLFLRIFTQVTVDLITDPLEDWRASIDVDIPASAGKSCSVAKVDFSNFPIQMNVIELATSQSSAKRLDHAGSSGCFDIRGVDERYHRVGLQFRPSNQKIAETLLQLQEGIYSDSELDIDVQQVWFMVTASLSTRTRYVDHWDILNVTILLIVLGYMGDIRAEVFHADSSVDLRSARRLYAQDKIVSSLREDQAWSWYVQTGRDPYSELSSDGNRSVVRRYVAQAHDIIYLDSVDESTSVLRSFFSEKPSHQQLLRLVAMIHLICENSDLRTGMKHRNSRWEGNLKCLLQQFSLWFGLESLAPQFGPQAMTAETLDQRCLLSLGQDMSIFNWPRVHDMLDRRDMSMMRSMDSVLGSKSFDNDSHQIPHLLKQALLFDEFKKLMKKPISVYKTRGPIETLLQHGRWRFTFEGWSPVFTRYLSHALLECQTDPPTTWSHSLLHLIGRDDLGLLLENPVKHTSAASQSVNLYSSNSNLQSICNSHEHDWNQDVPRTDGYEDLLQHVFRDDKRWAEAARLVDPVRVAIATVFPTPGQTESELLEKQKEVAKKVHERTMALPTGQAIFRFGVNKPILTEKVKITTFNTTCNMQPSNNSVNADKQNFTEEKVGWAYFHAGVSAGLQVARDAQNIDTSWLVLNKPEHLGIRHAGLLLGLGLNGHLKKMARWLAFQYLTSKHTMTSVGLLLGLSASNLGSQDSLVTRLISVHVTKLLPPGAAQLNISPLTQTAGILGIGLLYCNTQHRRMSEVMLSEIENVDSNDNQSSVEGMKDESYRFAAGCSLGLINLGMGADLRALHDLHLSQRLLGIATGPRQIKSVHVLDQAVTGATLALGMIFMKTHDTSLATKLDPIESPNQFDQTRADVLLLRTVAKWLIMWNDVYPSLDWVDRNRIKSDHTLSPLNSDNILSYNITAGLCWAISLKYAGTGSPDALSVLKYYTAHVRSLLAQAPLKGTFDDSLTLSTLQRFHHLLALAMATVCAGTGDLCVLRELRAMHATIEGKTFGLHQATHMAIGLLFLGHGRYTLGTSNLAVATMIMSFFPLFPRDVHDNRACLQAIRHFWVFATDARCIIPRDAETMTPLVVPIEVGLKSSIEPRISAQRFSQRRDHIAPSVRYLVAPTLIPALDTIAYIRTASASFWPVSLDFGDNSAHFKAFQQHQSMFLLRKPPNRKFRGRFGAIFANSAQCEQGKDDTVASLKWLFDLPAMNIAKIDGAGDRIVKLRFSEDAKNARDGADRSIETCIDIQTTTVDDILALNADGEASNDRNRLMWVGQLVKQDEAQEHITWLGRESSDALRRVVIERMRGYDLV